ncbi:MAG: AMP-binding protein [Gammaproteobacteria bacterium]
MTAFAATYQASIEDPARFWAEAASAVSWYQAPKETFKRKACGLAEWFPDATLNTCFNALDRHVMAGRGDQPALIYDSPLTGTTRRFTYRELQHDVARFAGVLRELGVCRGDRVVVYLPMIPEAVVAMLACARIGAVHCVVFGGFAAPELAKRIDDAKPRVVLSASCGIEPKGVVAYKPLLDAALEKAAHQVTSILILQRRELRAELHRPRDLDWHDAVARAAPAACVPVGASDPLYILYTSGTTGIPKGVVRDNGGHAVALAWSLRHVFGMEPGEIFWAASDIGWVVGHSYIVYAPLIAGCTTILYEGKPVATPDAGAFWRVIREHRVQVLFTSPTALRAIKREDPQGLQLQSGVGRLRAVFLAGERADPDTVRWAEGHCQVPVIDNWWQTELGWPALATCLGLGERAVRHGSAGHAVPGYQFAVLNSQSEPQAPCVVGDICIRLPLPPGCLATLWKNDAGLAASYLAAHSGFYLTGDAGFIDVEGFVHVMSRVDDIINVAGHRLSSGGIEQVMAEHADVAECAVIGAADAIKGMVPVGLLVLKSGVTRASADVIAEVARMIRDAIGAIAACKTIVIVEKLPKTRSGKILRSVIRRIADGESFATPATIEDPQALDGVSEALRAVGYNQTEVNRASGT